MLDRMQHWYSYSLVWVLYCDDLHTLFMLQKTFLALLSLPSYLTILPKYVKLSLIDKSSPSTVTGAALLTLRVMTSVLVQVTCSPTF